MSAAASPVEESLANIDRIVADPHICNGLPVVRGTRISLQTVLGFLAAGDSVEDVLEAYPSLCEADVRACLLWITRLMENHFRIQAIA